jgi:hypothetical protein
LLFVSRFVAVPASALGEKLDGQMKGLEDEVDKLHKRLAYLETTQKNSREHIEKMLRAGGGG